MKKGLAILVILLICVILAAVLLSSVLAPASSDSASEAKPSRELQHCVSRGGFTYCEDAETGEVVTIQELEGWAPEIAGPAGLATEPVEGLPHFYLGTVPSWLDGLLR